MSEGIRVFRGLSWAMLFSIAMWGALYGAAVLIAEIIGKLSKGARP